MRSWLCLLLAGCSFESSVLPGGSDAAMPDASGPCVPTGPEMCNGIDDDCNDGADEDFPTLGDPCDSSSDTDTCNDDVFVCSSDQTAVRCNNVGGDVNTQTDINNCGACGNTCRNAHGTTMCATGMCMPVCATTTKKDASNNDIVVAVAQDCDGDVDNGCERFRNNEPGCGSPTPTPLMAAGDENNDDADFGEGGEWFALTITENNSGDESLDVIISLDSHGNDFDLYVYCTTCGAGMVPIGFSEGDIGQVDSVHITKADNPGASDTYVVLVEVRYFRALTCELWDLTVNGDTGLTNPVSCP